MAAVEQIRVWFDERGWQLEPAELRAALQERGADVDVVVELIDEGADRRRARPPAIVNGNGAGRVVRSPDTPVQEPPHNVPPQNLEAEESVLGAMMLSQGAITAVSEIVEPGDFYRETHAKIFRAALALDAAGEPVDAITLTDKLEERGELEDVGGRVRIHELAALVPATANVGHYGRIVHETATLRGLIRAGGEIARLGWERPGEAGELVDQAQQLTHMLGDRTTEDRTEQMDGLVMETFQAIEEREKSGTSMVGVPTGFRMIDRLTGGLRPGNLIVVAARPGMGKTAIVHAIMRHVAVQNGLPVGLFTIEMSKAEVTGRLLAQQGNLDVRKLLGGMKVADADWPRLASACDALAKAQIFVNDKGDPTMAYVRAIGRRLKQQHPSLALLVVDFLQLMAGHGENRTQEVSKLSRGLKVLARELDVPVIAVSQLNRGVEQRVEKRPQLADLRESGSIEQDADLVALLYRDEYYNPETTTAAGVGEFIIAKNRNGPTDMVKLAFVKTSANYTDLETRLPGDMGA